MDQFVKAVYDKMLDENEVDIVLILNNEQSIFITLNPIEGQELTEEGLTTTFNSMIDAIESNTGVGVSYFILSQAKCDPHEGEEPDPFEGMNFN